MKNYSSNRAQKGKTAYRTPSRWIKGQPEKHKKQNSHLFRVKENHEYFGKQGGFTFKKET